MEDYSNEMNKINIKNSQNFLHNPLLVKKLVELSSISKEDLVVEIGPGKGIITSELSLKAKEVIAVEYDEELYSVLKNQVSSNTSIIKEDFLTYELPKNKKYKVFSNIPFNLTAAIINKLLTNENLPEDIFLIMQYEAFLNYSGAPYAGECYKSLLYKPIYDTTVIYEFDKEDFSPIPNVNIALARFELKKYSDIKKAPLIEYWDFVSYIHTAPGTNLKQKTSKLFTYEQLKRSKKYIGIDLDESISKWTYIQWLRLFETYIQFVSEEKKHYVRGSYSKMNASQKSIDKIYRTRIDEDWKKDHGRN